MNQQKPWDSTRVARVFKAPPSEDKLNSTRYKAFRADILTKHQPIMTAVASMLTAPAAETTPAMIDAAFDTAIKRFA